MVCTRRLLELDTFLLVAIVPAVQVRLLLAIHVRCVVPSLTARRRLGGILRRRVGRRGGSHPASSVHGLRTLDAAAAGVSSSTTFDVSGDGLGDDGRVGGRTP